MGHTPDNVKFVASRTFKTNKRTLGPFSGPAEYKKLLITPPNGQEICGFQGRRGWYIDAIGIVFRPIPKP